MSNHAFLTALDEALAAAVARVRQSPFVAELLGGPRARDLYRAYLREAFHFVRLTSGFTPLAARRMDPALLELRQWILHHSADEMGHELMARDDLADLGDPPEVTDASRPGPGTLAWVQFFHYQVCVRPPFAALGVLYFLEGMSAGLAMVVSTTIARALGPAERSAVRFFREHGELDQKHVREQRELLARHCTVSADQEVVLETVAQAGHVKRFLLDSLREVVDTTIPVPDVRVIGVVRSPLASRADAPMQGHEGAPDAWIEIAPDLLGALDRVDAGDELIVLTWLHLAARDVLQVHPRSDPTRPLTGVFGTRSPDRPNPIGLHRVTVRERDGRRLKVGPLEAIDGTPVLDLKVVLGPVADH
jgi:tRNA-Thr(GGU) m(6)t(6)A37 methyltransferase TsaA